MVAVGELFLSYAVAKPLDEVLKALILIKTSSKNVDRLWNLLERLQPSVEKLSSVQDQNHPASKWLTELHQQLEKCLKLANNHRNVQRNILRRHQTSRTALTLYASIHGLLQEAAVHQWAYGLSINSILVEHNVKILEELTISQERDEQLLRSSAELTSKVDLQSIITGPKQVSSSEILDGSSSSAVPLEILPMNTCDVPKPQVTFGGEAVANSIINHLLHEEYRKWVGLWGMGGIGKTFTATKVYHDPRIQRHFSGGMFWITVSKDRPTLNHLFKQLLEKVKGPNSISQLPQNVDAAKSYLTDLLDRDRVLLVLDDVWQCEVTRYFDVVSEHRKGIILVTTRDRDILKQVMDFRDIYETPRLSEEDSWQLFAWHAFHSRGRRIAPDVEVVAKMVAEECRGLPLALSVIGSTMANKEVFPDEIALGATLLREYEIALERLRKANHGKNEYEDLFRKLQLSVDSLRDEDCRLQDCFFYFAAFPEDEEVDVEDLVNMWNAEGLVQGDVSGVLSGKEVGKILLRVLVAKAMIEVIWEGSHCKIHDVMRDVAQRNLKRNVGSGEEITASGRACLYAPGLRDCRLPEQWISSGVSCSAKRLSLRGNDFRQFPEPEHFNAPHLELLILSRNSKLHLLAPRFFQNLPNLKVLDLSYTGLDKISGALLERLKSLVLLNLEGCSELQEISDKIDRLQCLEYLFLKKCQKLQKLPRVENLSTLKFYRVQSVDKKVSKGASADFRFWKSCNPWRTRGGPYLLPPNLRVLCILSHQSLCPIKEKYSFDVSSLGFLEKLTLEYVPLLPAGLEKLRALKVLQISGHHNSRAHPALGELPLLRDLSIHIDRSDGTEAFGHKGAFPSLRNLRIRCSVNMEKMFILHPGTMPKIESLHLSMQKREHFPSSITELSTLKRLCLQLDPGSTKFSEERVEIGGRFYYRRAYVRDEDIELLFRQEGCFPALEFLSIQEALFERPDGGRGKYIDRLTKWPKHILDRQETGGLVIAGFP